MRTLSEYESPEGEVYELSYCPKGRYHILWKKNRSSEGYDALLYSGGIKACMKFLNERIVAKEGSSEVEICLNEQQRRLIRELLCELAKKHPDEATQHAMDSIFYELDKAELN